MGLKSRKQVISPCQSICRLDARDVCKGCGRTKKEIREWKIYSDKRRRVIMNRLLNSDTRSPIDEHRKASR
ncbi:MAG: DUF1289 domain-containing protein [Alphaproteobacteria bacterium]